MNHLLRIRAGQMRVFEKAAVGNFVQTAVRHLQENAPVHCGFLGDDGTREAVEYGLRRAEKYDLTTERSLLMYLDLMFMLCRDFDRDPLLPWAVEILRDQGISSELARMNRLYQKASEYLQRVVGPKNEYIDAALRAIRQETPRWSHGGDFEAQMVWWFERIYPEKTAYIGDQGIRALLQRGAESAKAHGIGSHRGLMIYTALMFLLGSHFSEDPLFRWARDILDDSQIPDEPQKVDRLYAASMNCLEQWTEAMGSPL